MKLKSLKVSNFRCYKDLLTVEFDDFTAFIGRNDAGKSTVLDALDVFFNDKPLDKNDYSKQGDSKIVTITCIFCELPDELVLDETAPSSLSKENLLNSNGDLEITKIYNCALEKPKLVFIKLNAVHPISEELKDLLGLKIDELKKRAETVVADMQTVNKTIKSEIREAIRKKFENAKLSNTEIILFNDSTNQKDNFAKIWEGLRAALPMYALFKSDRQSSDQDAEAQDPLKIAIKEAIGERAGALKEIMDFVESEVSKVALITLEKLKEMDAAIASTLAPKFERPNWSSLIKASITGDDEIPLNKRGSGVRRLILLNFFRAKVERMTLEKNTTSTIFAVEEPETSQHPHNQRLLMGALQKLAISQDQVIVTTHTPMLARSLPSTSLRFVGRAADGRRTIETGGTEEINLKISASLGVLPDHTVKIFVVVEGIHDVTFLKNLVKMFAAHGVNVPDLTNLELKGELVFVPSGGANNLALWASRLSALNRPEFHLFDRDAPSYQVSKHQDKVDAVNVRAGCKAVTTSRLEMENFVHFEAINKCAQNIGLPCNLMASYSQDADVPKLLSVYLNTMCPAHSKWGENKVKAWLAEYVLTAMDARMLQEIDPHDEMLGWLKDIEILLQTH